MQIIDGMLTMMLQGLAGGLPMVTRDARDGLVILSTEERLRKQILTLAKNDKNVRKYLLNIGQNTAYAGIAVTVIFGILIPILDNHGMRPALFGGSKEERPLDVPTTAPLNGAVYGISN